MYNNESKSNNQSFSDSELSKGFHLLTESSHDVKVNTTLPENAHLYPRLAGSNWTSYLSKRNIILGRSGITAQALRATRQKPSQLVDIDFGSSKAVSRKHCEIRYSSRRDRWELYVYGRNGIKINHATKKHKDAPTVLKTGSLIEINNTSFVFILPDNYIKPTENQEATVEVAAETPNNDVEDLSLDQDLELAIIDVFKGKTCLDVMEIMRKLKDSYWKTVKKDTILHLLVLSQKFQLALSSIAMSSKESDNAKWILTATDIIPREQQEEYSITATTDKSTDGMSISTTTPRTLITTPVMNKENNIMRMESTDDMSITSTPSFYKQAMRGLSRDNMAMSRDDMSISTPNNEPAAEFPRISSILRDTSHLPAPGSSFSRFFDSDEAWSLFMPEQSTRQENTEASVEPEEEAQQQQDIPGPNPIPFVGMSIESMYTVWSHASSVNVNTMNEDNTRPNKRMRHNESLDNMSVDENSTEKSTPKPADIYKELRTKIVYNQLVNTN